MYQSAYATGVAADLKRLPRHARSRILDQIAVQLKNEPARPTRNRKIVVGLIPPWDHRPPVWELRIGVYRAFYDIDELASTVVVRAIRHKPAHNRTEDIL